ncbi:hypothetical protein, variant [Batrachochytrium dendrobatidis JEL423]|nr:hypothetical protein, variant [Batrachochytrium dendrobatidis JEL423]
MNPYYPYQQGVGYQHPPPQQYWSNPSQQHQQPSAQHPTFVRMPQSVDTPTTSATTVPDTSNAASSPSLGSNALQKSSTEKFNNSNAPLNAHGGSRPANNSGPATVSQTSSVPKSTQDTSEAVAKSLGQMKIGGEPPSKDSGVTKKNPGLPKPTQSNQARKSQAKHTDLPQENTDLLALPPKPPVVKAGGNTTQDRDQQQTNDGNRHSRGHRGTNRSYHNDRYNRNFQNQRTQKTEIPDSEFDFESSNAKFDRAIPEQAQTEATLNSDAQFYSKGGFFDNISCDSRDRVEGQWIDRHTRATQERQTNMETFGQTGSSRGGHQRRYNNNRGSYYHNNNNANGSSFKQFNNETGGNKTVNSSGDGSNGANYNRRSRGRNDQQYDHRNAGDSKNTAAPQTTNTSQS